MVIRVYRCVECGVEKIVNESMNNPDEHVCLACKAEMKSVPQVARTTYNRKGRLDK